MRNRKVYTILVVSVGFEQDAVPRRTWGADHPVHDSFVRLTTMGSYYWDSDTRNEVRNRVRGSSIFYVDHAERVRWWPAAGVLEVGNCADPSRFQNRIRNERGCSDAVDRIAVFCVNVGEYLPVGFMNDILCTEGKASLG